MRKKIMFLLWALLLFVNSSNILHAKGFDIADIYWVGENIDPSYLLDRPSPLFTLALTFQIKYTGNINYSNIDSIKVIAPDPKGYWISRPNRSNQDAKSSIIEVRKCYFGDGNTMPLGEYRIEVHLKNGTTKSMTKLITFPGSTSTSGYNYIYAGESGSSFPSNYGSMLNKASKVNGIKTATELIVNFQTSDKRVFDGWLWLYDGNKKCIGYSAGFRFMKNIVKTDGTVNTITIPVGSPYFVLDSPFSFADIRGCHIVLRDGSQYTDEHTYDYQSISEYIGNL